MGQTGHQAGHHVAAAAEIGVDQEKHPLIGSGGEQNNLGFRPQALRGRTCHLLQVHTTETRPTWSLGITRGSALNTNCSMTKTCELLGASLQRYLREEGTDL